MTSCVDPTLLVPLPDFPLENLEKDLEHCLHRVSFVFAFTFFCVFYYIYICVCVFFCHGSD
jgi:hypothetical protein